MEPRRARRGPALGLSVLVCPTGVAGGCAGFGETLLFFDAARSTRGTIKPWEDVTLAIESTSRGEVGKRVYELRPTGGRLHMVFEVTEREPSELLRIRADAMEGMWGRIEGRRP